MEASIGEALAESLCRESDLDMTEAEMEAAVLAQSRMEYEQEQLRQLMGRP